MNEYKFFVNEEKGIVVATIKRQELSRLVWSMSMRKVCRGAFGSSDEFFTMGDVVLGLFYKWFNKRYKFSALSATARCNFEAGDVFDEEIGRYIAEDKLDVKVANIAREFCYYMCEQLYNFADVTRRKALSLSDFIVKTEDNLYELGD